MASARVAALTTGYEAFAEDGRVDAGIEAMPLDPDIEWRPLDGEGEVEHGAAGVRRAMARWLDSWEGYWVQPEEFIEREDEVVVLIREGGRGSASGVEIERSYAHVWTFRGARIVRFHAMSTEQALDPNRNNNP
jgi:ketosteroid isomerase-like protein